MKVGLLLLFLLHFHDALSLDPVLPDSGKTKKNRKIFMSRRLLKPNLYVTKKPLAANNGYTVFSSIADHRNEKKFMSVPESPYFSASKEHRTRVKKVLPDYALGAIVRKKRSADVVKQNETAAPTHPVKVAKGSEALNKNTSLSRRMKKKSKRKLKNKRKRSRDKRAKKLRKRKHILRTNMANNLTHKQAASEKHLKYTKRPSLRHKGNKTNGGVKVKSERSHKGDEKVKAVPKKEKKKEKDARRLIAARDAAIEDYPYSVSIQKSGEHWCAGALLNPRLVITTANCVWKSNRLSRLKVRVGSRYTDRGGQTAWIQEMMKHPEWSIRKNPDMDVALLLLDRDLKFSDTVHGVDLPNRIMMPAFEDAWVTSWGAERRDGVFDKDSMTLQSIHTRLIDRAKCNNITQRFGVTVSENFICLSQMGTRAPCTRDTGAPAVSDGVLWGLASWGIRKLCGTRRFPAMFSYIASQRNLDFILNATHTLMADERFSPFLDRYSQQRAAVTSKSPFGPW